VVNGGSVRNQGGNYLERHSSATPEFQWSSTVNLPAERLYQATRRWSLDVIFSRVYNNSDQTVFHQVEEGGRRDFMGQVMSPRK
jgi:hypothetical protein